MIFFLNFIVIKSRFIVFKITAQIIQTQQNKKKGKKCKGADKLSKNCQNFTFWQFWGILNVFSLISRPPLIFFQFFSFGLSLCDLCSHFEYNKHRLYDNFFPKINSFKGGCKKHVLSF